MVRVRATKNLLRLLRMEREVPQGIPELIATELDGPIIDILRHIVTVVGFLHNQENYMRATQGRYQLKKPSKEHWIEATKDVIGQLTKCTKMYINSHPFGIIGGGQRGEREAAKEPSESNDPYGDTP